ncbi:hypothetical protein GNI_152410 [Gregarina niphandrodes]|uniref:Transmembrane protein n=1 Tax=Gregarina niphandrodes TaxID=110365 RepID=A0A023B0C3_GRENI|nr:hypothetical protein GNI_152410 [Gregarina niphandrodes]EZG44094.1 hypothetical protein GNI_152410 [Gregarina niphandrodes]|eukprot:XP_011132805.1 hypothetical protein GNI_152410 [Gregarina niphandrodes]
MLRNIVLFAVLASHAGVMFEGGQRLDGFLLNSDGYLEAKATKRVFDSRDFITQPTTTTTTTTTTAAATDDSGTDTGTETEGSAASGLAPLHLKLRAAQVSSDEGNRNDGNRNDGNSSNDIGNAKRGNSPEGNSPGSFGRLRAGTAFPTLAPRDSIPSSRAALDMSEEARMQAVHAPQPLKAGSLVNYSDDILIDVQRNPINPLYVDHTDYGNWLHRQWSTYDSGWRISVNVTSRSKRCRGLSCPAEAASSVASLGECIAISAPGCVLSYSMEMTLDQIVHACCRDELESRDWHNEGISYIGNYTWLLPTPRIAIELAQRGNVTTRARFRRPYYGDGIHKADITAGGFGITKRNGVCADYFKDSIGDYVYTIGTPTGCQIDDTGLYMDCNGVSDPADGPAWNQTNADQLLFVGTALKTNCICLSAQYPLVNATLTYATLVYPSPGAATRDGLHDRQLDFGYNETPTI